VRPELVQADPDVLGAAQLPAVRHGQQVRAASDPEGVGEVVGLAAPLVVGEAEADHAAAGVLDGQPGEGACVHRVARAVGGDHHRHPETGRRGGLCDRVQDQVGEGGDPAEAGAVPAGVDLDLQPPTAVADV